MSEAARSRLIPEVDFNAEGKQTGFIRLFHSVHASAYGFIPIPIVVVKNGEGPTALFVSGNHGDEYEGQVALCNLARTLEPSALARTICTTRHSPASDTETWRTRASLPRAPASIAASTATFSANGTAASGLSLE